MTHMVPGVPKSTHLPWASQGSYIATLKLHALVLTSFVSSVCYIAVDTLLLLLFIASSKNNPLYPDFINSYIYNLKLHTHFFAPPFFQNKKQANLLIFIPPRICLPEIVFFNIQASWGHICTIQSCIHFISLCLSWRNKKKSIH